MLIEHGRAGPTWTLRTLMNETMKVERALELAIAETHVPGVSTRKVSENTRKPCDLEVTSTTASRASAQLAEQLEVSRM